MQNLLQDIRYAFRQLMKSPGFSAAAVLSLAIGIGANTAMFSSMDAVVLRPLAVPELDRVVTLGEHREQAASTLDPDETVAFGNYLDWRRLTRSYEELGAYAYASMSLTGAGDAEHVELAQASGGFFTVLRAQPLLGRIFGDADCQPGRDQIAILNYGFWQRRFGSDPAVIGRKIQLDQREYTIVGVMPKSMQYPSRADLYTPLAPGPQQLANRTERRYIIIGRLRSGTTVAQAQAELRTIAQRLAAAYPVSNEGWSAKVEPLLDGINGTLTPLYYKLIMGATLFVLLVVCANIANLQVARGITRRPEIAMRTAMGASRSRILRQLLIENILLACIGAAGGIVLGAIHLHIILITMPARVARFMAGWSSTSLNGRALAFSILLAVMAGIVAGIAPAVQALRLNVVDQLKAGSRSTIGSSSSHRLRNIFAIAQISLAVALVIGATLMSKGMQRMLHLGDIYHPDKTLAFNVNLSAKRFDTPQKQVAWYAATLEKLRAIPGITHAEVSGVLPYSENGWSQDFAIENRPIAAGKIQSALRIHVSEGYFSAFHVPLIAGRTFASSDSLESIPVAVVSRRFVERYFPGQNPIGKRIRMGGPQTTEPWVTIVGVVEEVRYSTWDQTPETEVYLDEAQLPSLRATYAVMTNGEPKAFASEVRKTMASVDATIPLDDLMTYEQYLHELLTGLRYADSSLIQDGLIALLLAAIGIFGVMANMVAERTREIGVRLAMGARREDVLRLVMSRASRLTFVGLGVGLALAYALARGVAGLLVGVRSDDPLVFSAIAASITAIAMFASWLPARRAAHVDPIIALRDE